MRRLNANSFDFNVELALIQQEHVDRFLAEAENKSDKEVVKPLFERLMRADPANVAHQVNALKERVSAGKGNKEEIVKRTEELAVRLNEQYPGDVGCFVAYFLNYLNLTPGQAVFLGPNVPHAYLQGYRRICNWSVSSEMLYC